MPGYLLYEILLVAPLAPCLCEVGKLILPSRSTVSTNTVVDVKLPDIELWEPHIPLIDLRIIWNFKTKTKLIAFLNYHYYLHEKRYKNRWLALSSSADKLLWNNLSIYYIYIMNMFYSKRLRLFFCFADPTKLTLLLLPLPRPWYYLCVSTKAGVFSYFLLLELLQPLHALVLIHPLDE